MRAMTVDKLQVPDAELYYEVRGRGPALLMIPGGPADASIFTDLGDQLMDRYTVITYDPRGSSRSSSDGLPGDLRVEVHADDAARLIAAVDEGPAYVFGSSNGAVYGLDLAAYYPAHVRALVAHEPPTTNLLPDAGRWRMLAEDVHATHMNHGDQAAMEMFAEATGLAELDGPNVALFFRVLLPAVTEYVPAIDTLRRGGLRVVVGGGEASDGQVAYRTACALAKRLDTSVALFPGDHTGFRTQPEAFADRLHEVLGDVGSY